MATWSQSLSCNTVSVRLCETGPVVGLFLTLAVGAAGCAFDSAPLRPAEVGVQPSSAPSPPDAAAAGSLNGGPNQVGGHDAGQDAGGTGVPSDLPDPTIPLPDGSAEAGAAPQPDAGGDAAASAGSIAPPPPPPPPPPRGSLFSRCVNDYGCAPGLRCYGEGPGYCGEACTESSDCIDHEGVDFTCSPNETACRVDCSPSGTGGRCPAALTCLEAGGGRFRCRLPPEQGKGDQNLFEPCDRAHGDSDCMAGLACYRAPESATDGPGYCANSCDLRGNASCQNMAGGETSLGCDGMVCRFTCGEAPCPPGMECEQAGSERLCHYPP